MKGDMQIGELAARLGLNPRTIRYYETIGLLPPADRAESGYRRYGERDLERLGFIRRATALGLSLDEIRTILQLRTAGELPCSQVLSLIDAKIGEVDRRIQELQDFRTELGRLRRTWTGQNGRPLSPPSSVQVCPIIEQQDEVAEHPGLAGLLEPSFRRHAG